MPHERIESVADGEVSGELEAGASLVVSQCNWRQLVHHIPVKRSDSFDYEEYFVL